MNKVILTGWKVGLAKIPLDLLIKERASLRLSEAKNKVDQLLDNTPITLIFQSSEEAKRFLQDALLLGAVGEAMTDD